MAERRMFRKTIVLSDRFLDMPLGARCLYMTMGMLADDDGFVNSPKSIMRQTGATEDDMKILIRKKFILPFESGVIVIKHWRINNYLQKDRYKETKYLEEKAQLRIDEKGAYTASAPCIQSVYTDKVNIGKVKLDYISFSKNENKKIYDDLSELTERELLKRSMTNAEEQQLAQLVNDYTEKEILHGIRQAAIYEKPSLAYVTAIIRKEQEK